MRRIAVARRLTEMQAELGGMEAIETKTLEISGLKSFYTIMPQKKETL